MSITLESALDIHENEEQFGLKLQLEAGVQQHSSYTTVFGIPEKKKKPVKKEESISVIALCGYALREFAKGLWDLFLYLGLWYVIYPSLLFVSIYLSQTLLKPDMTTLTSLLAFNSLLAGCAGLYYAYHLLITFIGESSHPAMYFEEKPKFLLHITCYSLVAWFVLHTAGLLNAKTFLNSHNQWLFISFYVLYLVGTSYLKFFSYRIKTR